MSFLQKSILVIIISFSFIAWSKPRQLVDSPARAIWYSENKLKLTLPTNLNANGIYFYFLNNEDAKLKIPLSVTRAYGNKVELEVTKLNQYDLSKLITGPLSVLVTNSDTDIIDQTSVQLHGILDSRFYYGGNDLGVMFSSGDIQLKVWSPTANNVTLYLFKKSNDQNPEIMIPMSLKGSGVWSTRINLNYNRYYYLFKINVFSPATKNIETYLVTDPYSRSLSTNSTKSQIVNVNDQDLMPLGWDNLVKKESTNKIIYETHLRDLTANDSGLPAVLQGTYEGLVTPSGKAYQHLKKLAESGLSYIHFLPLNDFASVNEDKSTWEKIDLNEKYSGASEYPQSVINRIRHVDSYNWGYDPFHYLTPDGSYSANPNGPSRIRELRNLVKGLDDIGLKTIIDVVFNHTYSSGSDSFSVFNKIVPLYYYRLDENGNVANSTCCSDTASEHKMMEKLMIDSLVYWAKTFKVDGFRFDLMAFHTRKNLENIKEELSKLTIEKDGVDGKNLYLYGEGWSFGSLYEKNPAESFNQLNSYGAGIGFFNDRFRDAIRGGTTDSQEKSDQGFATGLFSDFNNEIANRNTPTDLNQQKIKLSYLGDVVKYGLAGNLRDFKIKNFEGNNIAARDYFFRGVPVGYAATTDETVNYVSAHDGYCLWDSVSAKAPFYSNQRSPKLATTFDKQRMVQLSLGLTLFSQGVPFIEGGSEILRSKSGDVDSYDSGDWFNHLNFDLNDNNWAKGIPPSFKNYNDWNFWYPRLNDIFTKPKNIDIEQNLKAFKAYLQIRSNSSLFNSKNLEETTKQVTFFDNDEVFTPGLIAMRLKNSKEEMIIIFNSNRYSVNFVNKIFGRGYKIHPELTTDVDPMLSQVSISKSQITIPEKTILVLVPEDK
jgi:pullulanase